MSIRSWRALLLPFLCLTAGVNRAPAQTSATGWVTITGSIQGPLYPCGSGSCPTYDSGQITITVNGFNAVTTYGNTAGQKTSAQLAKALATQLNSAASPVTATVLNANINLTSKLTGTQSNYSFSTQVTNSLLFSSPSFNATPSGPTLTGGSGSLTSIGSLIQQTSNNTSLCSSASDPGSNLSYCNAFFNGFGTNPANLSSQTLVPDSAAGHVSNISLKELLYRGWNGRMICEYQPWFGMSSHQSVGYNENSSATAAAQDSFMINEGCDINLVDWYGSLDPSQSFNLATANTVFNDLSTRSGYPLKFGVMEDKGSLLSICPTTGQTESATVTCLQGALIQDMDYVNNHYANNPVYWTDQGNPVICSFVTESLWPVLTASDWDTIWSVVKAHTDGYAVPFKYVFQFGAFSSQPYDAGRFGWIQPTAYSKTQQFWWGSSTSLSPTYLNTLYSAGLSHSSQLTIGALWKGFDDYYASWSGNRVIAQQCGRVWLRTAREIAKYFGTQSQIPYVQVITWNDYEEGTAVEDGIDNCYSVNASLSGNLLSWSLLASDPVYASTTTIHHFNIYFADAAGNLYTAASNLPVSQSSLDVSALIPTGTWSLYVEMVGQPLIINRMSSALSYIH